jgi:heat shock protein HslJ
MPTEAESKLAADGDAMNVTAFLVLLISVFASGSNAQPTEQALRLAIEHQMISQGLLVPDHAGDDRRAVHRSGFPVHTLFILASIDERAFSDRRRTFNIDLALNGNPYGVGFGGCHGWGANVEMLEHGQIKFESVGTDQGQPQGPCNADEQKGEDQFLAVLRQAIRWRIDGSTLIVESDANKLRMTAPVPRTSVKAVSKSTICWERLPGPARSRRATTTTGITSTARSMPTMCSAIA